MCTHFATMGVFKSHVINQSASYKIISIKYAEWEVVCTFIINKTDNYCTKMVPNLFVLFFFNFIHLKLKKENTTLKVPDMIHNIVPQFFFSNPFWYQKLSHIFLTFVVTFGVNIPSTLGEINRNVAWKLENVSPH